MTLVSLPTASLAPAQMLGEPAPGLDPAASPPPRGVAACPSLTVGHDSGDTAGAGSADTGCAISLTGAKSDSSRASVAVPSAITWWSRMRRPTRSPDSPVNSQIAQREPPIEGLGADQRAGVKECSLVSRCRQGPHADVRGEVDRFG